MRTSRSLILLALLGVLAPALLVLSAVRTYRALDGQRAVYLRSRVAALAALLETLPEALPEEEWKDALLDEEPALTDLTIFGRESSPPELAGLWEGRELFRTQRAIRDGEAVFRAYVPFHSGGQMRLARIDIAESASAFLVEHARHHVWFVAAGAATIAMLALITARGVLRAERAEREQAELRHLAKIGEMSTVLAHEIRNPLGTIKGFAQLLGERLRGEHAALLDPILAQSTRLERLSKDLLLYGRKAEPVLQTIEAASIGETVRRHAMQSLEDAERHFESVAAELEVRTDPEILEQILLNLLRNAADAVQGRADALVRFEIAAAGTEVLLRLSDNGPGLSEEAQKRLFDPFFTSKASGTGLGLSISRKLAEALGGSLRIANGAAGGAVAELRLPQNTHGTDTHRG